MNKKLLKLLPVLLAAFAGLSVKADPPVPNTIAAESYHLQDLELGGTTRTDRWLAMNQFNYEQGYYGYNGALAAKAWTYAMKPNFPSAGSTAVFNKGTLTNGDGSTRQPNGYPALEGIYTLFTRTPFILTESSPLADLNSISFQIYLTTGGSDTTSGTSTEAYGPDGDLYQLPSLNLVTNTGSLSLAASTSSLTKSVPYEFDHSAGGVETTFTIYENYRLFQWDLSSVTGSILSFDITFATYEHVSLRSIQLDQSTALIAVPEPAAAALITASGVLAFLFLRRRAQPLSRS